MMTVGGGFRRPTGTGPTRSRASSRVLDPSRDERILGAVLTVLAEVGYRGLTMDEVAIAAGVSKATIYRRWSSKVELLVSFLDVAREDALVTADTGSLRGDLLVFLTSVAEVLEGPTGRATRAVIGDLAEEPAVAEAYRAGPLAWWDETLNEILKRAAGRGEMAPEAAASIATQAGPAILLQYWFVRGRTLDEDVVTAIVDEVMIPLLTHS